MRPRRISPSSEVWLLVSSRAEQVLVDLGGGLIAGPSCSLSGLPGVGLGRFAAGAGPDLVEPPKRVGGQVDLEGALAGGELVEGARADDRGGDRWLVRPGRYLAVGAPSSPDAWSPPARAFSRCVAS